MPGQAQKTDKKTKTPAAAPSSSSTAAKGGDEAQAKLGNAAVQEAIKAQSAGETNWKDAYGEKLGGAAWKQIAKNVTDEKVGELASKGADSLYGKLHDLSMEHLSPGTDPEKAEKGLAALREQIVPVAGEKGRESGLGTKARELIGEHPYATGGALLAGAAAYIATNQDLPLIEAKKKFGDAHTLKAGIDPGRTLDWGVEEAKLGYEYAKDGLKANLVGDWKKDDGYAVKGGVEKKFDSGALAALKGEYVDRKDDKHTRLDLSYLDSDLKANAYWERRQGDKTVDALGGSISNVVQNPDDIKAYLRGEYRTDGTYTAAGGLSQQLDDKSWSLEGYSGRDATGRSDSGIRAMFKWRF